MLPCVCGKHVHQQQPLLDRRNDQCSLLSRGRGSSDQLHCKAFQKCVNQINVNTARYPFRIIGRSRKNVAICNNSQGWVLADTRRQTDKREHIKAASVACQRASSSRVGRSCSTNSIIGQAGMGSRGLCPRRKKEKIVAARVMSDKEASVRASTSRGSLLPFTGSNCC
jgi:hypothetical protein